MEQAGEIARAMRSGDTVILPIGLLQAAAERKALALRDAGHVYDDRAILEAFTDWLMTAAERLATEADQLRIEAELFQARLTVRQAQADRRNSPTMVLARIKSAEAGAALNELFAGKRGGS